ncbi:MAG: hypothetical protein AB8B96_21080 [Lysobacterales bacterium]
MSIELPKTPLDNERLASLVIELASQLHVERAKRLALECALEDAGTLPKDWAKDWQPDMRHEERCQQSLDSAMGRLMKIMSEDTNPRTPLRHEAAAFETRG